MYSIRFEISTVPLTLNQVMSKHWRYRHANFQKIHKEIWEFLSCGIKKPLEPVKKANITITRYSPGSLDRDNAYFTCKPILDSLVELGVLIDDGWEQVKGLDVRQVKIKRGEPRRIEVVLEEIE